LNKRERNVLGIAMTDKPESHIREGRHKLSTCGFIDQILDGIKRDVVAIEEADKAGEEEIRLKSR
jgi:hypothetical protein